MFLSRALAAIFINGIIKVRPRLTKLNPLNNFEPMPRIFVHHVDLVFGLLPKNPATTCLPVPWVSVYLIASLSFIKVPLPNPVTDWS